MCNLLIEMQSWANKEHFKKVFYKLFLNFALELFT
jgi:hypothetical protein